MRIVVDASVAVKWFLPGESSDEEGKTAAALLAAVKNGSISLLQPPHWLAEVAAVLTRLSPSTALDDIALLSAMRIPQMTSTETYRTACRLAIASRQHVCDTLYHAVSLLTTGATLVTADLRYYRKARRFGAISLLADFDAIKTKGRL